MKIIEKEKLSITFNEIEIGECFKIADSRMYCMKTPLAISPTTGEEYNSVDLSTGCFDYFSYDYKVIKVDCELNIK